MLHVLYTVTVEGFCRAKKRGEESECSPMISVLLPLVLEQAVALSLQCIWRGKKGRERIANLRAVRVRRLGAAITIQKA